MITTILTFIFALVISAVVIWIVGRLGLGMEVDGFMSAIWAALVISIVTTIILWLLSLVGISIGGAGFWAAIVSLIVSAIVLMISDKFLSGMKVNGFVGAIVASVAIGVVNWLLVWVIGLFI